MARKKARKQFVYRDTIWNSVGGGFGSARTELKKVGKHKVLLTRKPRLDYYGNPVHIATYIKKNGDYGKSYQSSGSATMVVSRALKKNGIETKERNKRNKK